MSEPTEDDLREPLVTAHRILHHQGLVDYLGRASVRLPGTDRVIIKPKHSPRIRRLGDLKPEDLIVIDLDGTVLTGSGAGAQERPPAECFIHTEIYQARPDVAAVVHTHQPAGTTLGVIGADLLPVLHVPSVLADGGNIGTWPCPLLVDRPELGRELAAALGGRRPQPGRLPKPERYNARTKEHFPAGRPRIADPGGRPDVSRLAALPGRP